MQQVLGSRGRGLAARSQGEGAAAGRGRERPHKALTATDSTTPPLPQPLPSPSTPRNPGHPEMARGPPPPRTVTSSCSQSLGLILVCSELPTDTSIGTAWGLASRCWAPAVARGQGLQLSSAFSHTHTKCGSKRPFRTFPFWC